MPARRDIDPVDLPALLPNIVLVDVLGNGSDFRVRLVGTVVRERSKANHVGQLFSERFPDRANSEMWKDYSRVVSERQPVFSEIAYLGVDQYTRRACHFLFPLSTDGELVDMIIALIEYDRVLPKLSS